QARSERFAFDEGHRVKRNAVRLAGGEHRNDVRVLELGRQQDLAIEALDVHANEQVGRQNLDDDFALERSLFGEEHARHAPATDLALERIGASQCVLELYVHGGLLTRGGARAAGKADQRYRRAPSTRQSAITHSYDGSLLTGRWRSCDRVPTLRVPID